MGEEGKAPTQSGSVAELMMMMSTFIAHDSINLNAQCTGGGNSKKATWSFYA